MINKRKKKCKIIIIFFFSVWNIRTGERLHMLSGHTAAVRCVCYNGKYVVSGAYDHTIRVWLPDQERCVHTLEGHTNRVYSLVVCIYNILILIVF
jgi:WD40 repeat protein